MSNISVIQIFKKSSPEHKQTIAENSLFLENFNIEYVVADYQNDHEILGFIKSVPYAIYIKEKAMDTKETVLFLGEVARGDRLIFLEESDVLRNNNVETLEKTRLNILRTDLKKIIHFKIKTTNLSDLYLYMKSEKTFVEKLKLATKYLF